MFNAPHREPFMGIIAKGASLSNANPFLKGSQLHLTALNFYLHLLLKFGIVIFAGG